MSETNPQNIPSLPHLSSLDGNKNQPPSSPQGILNPIRLPPISSLNGPLNHKNSMSINGLLDNSYNSRDSNQSNANNNTSGSGTSSNSNSNLNSNGGLSSVGLNTSPPSGFPTNSKTSFDEQKLTSSQNYYLSNLNNGSDISNNTSVGNHSHSHSLDVLSSSVPLIGNNQERTRTSSFATSGASSYYLPAPSFESSVDLRKQNLEKKNVSPINLIPLPNEPIQSKPQTQTQLQLQKSPVLPSITSPQDNRSHSHSHTHTHTHTHSHNHNHNHNHSHSNVLPHSLNKPGHHHHLINVGQDLSTTDNVEINHQSHTINGPHHHHVVVQPRFNTEIQEESKTIELTEKHEPHLIIVDNSDVLNYVKKFPRRYLNSIRYTDYPIIKNESKLILQNNQKLKNSNGNLNLNSSINDISYNNNNYFKKRKLSSLTLLPNNLQDFINCLITIRIEKKFLNFNNENVLKRKLWGTEIYTDDSNLIAVLYHMGYLWDINNNNNKNDDDDDDDDDSEINHDTRKVNKGEEFRGIGDCIVTIQILPRLKSYIGCFKNGINSRNWKTNHDGSSFKIYNVEFRPEGESIENGNFDGGKGYLKKKRLNERELIKQENNEFEKNLSKESRNSLNKMICWNNKNKI